MPADLACSDCGRTYADRWRCECGHPLEFADRPLPDGPPPDPAAFGAGEGLWAFADFLPVGADPTDRVTLGEGGTPLVAADDAAGRGGSAGGAADDRTSSGSDDDRPAWNAQFKLEYVLPTGSFKDRGATTTLTRAVELGVDRVLEDSSGNAGAAIATYAARAGVEADVYVPASAKASKLRAIERAGATPVGIEGSREAVTDACLDAVAAGEGWYASHAWNPAFFAGTATFAHEIAAQRGWSAPDAVVTPLGHGTLFLGAYRGFRDLYDAGWIDRIPRLLGAQAAGYAPVAAELHGESAGTNDAADGIRIREPVQRDRILAAVEDAGGDAIAVGEPAVERELDALHAAGFYVEPTAAVGPAALREYRERGTIRRDDDVVVALTGSGLKG